MKKAIVLAALLGASPAFAASSPYYVGTNLTPSNHVNLNFQDTLVKSGLTTTNTGTSQMSSNNLVALDLRGAWTPVENANVTGSLPFYFANKNLYNGQSKNALGNFNLGGGYAWNFQTDNRAWNYGPTAMANVYTPLSRKAAGNSVAATSPTTDFYKYATDTTTAAIGAGFFLKGDMFSAKYNIGYGYMYDSSPNSASLPVTEQNTKKNRNTMVNQVAASYHVLPNLHVNAEYNTIWLDKKTKLVDARGAQAKAFRQTISPSVSGNWEQIIGSVFATVPLDKSTRKATSVAFGLNTGYSF